MFSVSYALQIKAVLLSTQVALGVFVVYFWEWASVSVSAIQISHKGKGMVGAWRRETIAVLATVLHQRRLDMPPGPRAVYEVNIYLLLSASFPSDSDYTL